MRENQKGQVGRNQDYVGMIKVDSNLMPRKSEPSTSNSVDSLWIRLVHTRFSYCDTWIISRKNVGTYSSFYSRYPEYAEA